jgi:poly-beta-1,6-N-acetyl-D-glucosamine synthase
MQWLAVILLLGVSFTLWMTVGGLRLVQQTHAVRKGKCHIDNDEVGMLSAVDVAVLIPAHNEEVTIGATLDSVRRIVPAGNIHVVADGCSDSTTAIARSHGVNVLEFSSPRGKAGGIEAAVAHFDICQRFVVLLILDADTQLDEHYIERGLTLLNDPEMAALAGYAHTTWRPEQLTTVGRFLISYRTRLYVAMQWIKYGQTWRYTNVTPIVPGFASMYRTDVLSKMEINPPGLVIEDFNMTFELHRKKLGKVAFEPSIFGRTQDPDNLTDYYRQIRRWWLGFWQTLRRHGLWCSWFSAALAVFLVEIVLASLIMTLAAVAVVILAAAPVTGGVLLTVDWYTWLYATLSTLLSPTNLLFFVFVPDYVVTCAVAIWIRRPSLLVYGLVFLFIRLIDSTAALWTLWQVWYTNSTGRWNSPRRRTVPGAKKNGGIQMSGPRDVPPGVRPIVMNEITPSAGVDSGRSRQLWHMNPVIRDTLLVGTVLALAAWIVAVAVPLAVALAAGIFSLVIGAIWSYCRQFGTRSG